MDITKINYHELSVAGIAIINSSDGSTCEVCYFNSIGPQVYALDNIVPGSKSQNEEGSSTINNSLIFYRYTPVQLIEDPKEELTNKLTTVLAQLTQRGSYLEIEIADENLNETLIKEMLGSGISYMCEGLNRKRNGFYKSNKPVINNTYQTFLELEQALSSIPNSE
jgi:hypothetical protein